MISLIYLLLASTAAFSALAAGLVENNNNNNLSKRQISESEQGTGADGFFYYFWTDGSGNVTYTNGDDGSYDVVWSSGSGNWFGGKGWAPGNSSPITYSATYHPTGTSYLSIYGWTYNNNQSLIEYFIVEDYHTTTSGSANGNLKGDLLSDGASYDIYDVTRISPGLGDPIIRQYWSVIREEDKRSSNGGTVAGTVTVQNHFDAWAGVGLELGGVHEWQIVAVEGYYSAGDAGVVVGR
ncbi:hypothetical protein FQN51_009254 [Onygenales sp. PD_10]|nr:hypothetical protein FQN51_009254 [Onygenales sp. PD_10]